MGFKVKKRKKCKKWRGNTTYGHGARKKWKKSGHHGGCGMAGTGKRADHKKSLIIKLYGNEYFGKQGVTSRSTQKKKNDVFNLREIEENYETLIKKYGKNNELILERYKILGEGELKRKIVIKAKAFSKSAIEKIEKLNGQAIIIKPKEKKEFKINKEKSSINIKPEIKKEKVLKK